MPLEILGPLVVAGIALVVLIVRFGANAPERLLVDQGLVWSIFQADFPASTGEGPAHISADRRVAIIPLSDPGNCIGVVMVMGSKHLTRLLTARDVQKLDKLDKLDGAGLDIVLHDFTLPDIPINFESAAARDEVLAMIEEHLDSASRAVKTRSTMA